MFNTNNKPQLVSAVFSKAIYYGALEILGVDGLEGLLKKAGDWDGKFSDQDCQGLSSWDCQDLLNSLIEHYGLLTAQGICLRSGRVIYQYLHRNFPEIIFNNTIEKRMQPLDKRITDELENLIQWLQKNLACQIGMEKEKENWIVRLKLIENYHPEINKISFYFFNGILQECLEWMDSRHRYKIVLLSDSTDDQSSYGISIGYQLID